MKKLIFIFLVLFDLGCKHTAQQRIEYYSNGNKKSIADIQNGILDGKRTGYYENGKIEYISFYKNDSLDGQSIFYDSLGKTMALVNYKNGIKEGFFFEFFPSNGFIRAKGEYRNGVLQGTLTQYFETDSARVMAQINYLNFRGEQKEFGSIWYDKIGNVIKELRRVKLEAKKDTVVSGESLKLILELKNPKFDSTTFFINNYNEEFYVINKSKEDTLKAKNHRYDLLITSSDKGKQFVRGYCLNWRPIKSNSIETIEECLAPIYFEYPYYVK